MGLSGGRGGGDNVTQAKLGSDPRGNQEQIPVKCHLVTFGHCSLQLPCRSPLTRMLPQIHSTYCHPLQMPPFSKYPLVLGPHKLLAFIPTMSISSCVCVTPCVCVCVFVLLWLFKKSCYPVAWADLERSGNPTCSACPGLGLQACATNHTWMFDHLLNIYQEPSLITMTVFELSFTKGVVTPLSVNAQKPGEGLPCPPILVLLECQCWTTRATWGEADSTPDFRMHTTLYVKQDLSLSLHLGTIQGRLSRSSSRDGALRL